MEKKRKKKKEKKKLLAILAGRREKGGWGEGGNGFYEKEKEGREGKRRGNENELTEGTPSKSR